MNFILSTFVCESDGCFKRSKQYLIMGSNWWLFNKGCKQSGQKDKQLPHVCIAHDSVHPSISELQII